LRDENGKYLGTIRVFEPGSSARFVNRRQDKLGAFGCLDALTGVLNHSMIQAQLKEHINLYALYPVPFSVMCYAVDDLDILSDRYGQAAKEAALRMAANGLKAACGRRIS
jgi:GGDEF domain-containing protein